MGSQLNAFYRTDERWYFVWVTDTDDTALWDLQNDPGQTEDVSSQNAELIDRFKTDIAAWRERYM